MSGGLRLTVLGSGTCAPDPARGPAGLLVETEAGAWLVDGGSGTLRSCASAGVDPRALSGGVYSHRHVDHIGDLAPLLFAMKVGPPPRTSPYPIWAGRGMSDFLDRLRGAYHGRIDPPGGVLVHELSLEGPDRADLGGVMLRTAPAAHSAGALHLRFERGGTAVVFSGDTGPSPALAELARGADLLVCECASPADAPIPGHLGPAEVADLVDAARPAAVWLTHFYAGCDPVEAVRIVSRVGRPTRRADDLDRWPDPIR